MPLTTASAASTPCRPRRRHDRLQHLQLPRPGGSLRRCHRHVGHNPLTVAVPSGKYPDLVLDMATSTVAKGKIALALKEGKSIPDNWALAPDAAPPQTPL